ncbi:MAG: HEAT repeat domain-containing protein [bacterium]|nr:HEAT repeat domain-containing protein [bacterium]
MNPRPGATASIGKRRARIAALLGLALLLTALNAVKPLHIDDPFIHRVAEQVRADPTDPYGFDIFWLQWPQPVHEELTPPVVPYWWALGLTLAEHPVAWKLWLFPFALILTVALHSILRRFARGVELPVVALTVLSPAILPGFNLMQDVPALALAAAALALYFEAHARDSWVWALAAGGLAGLATQTKYTAVAVLAVIALHGLLSRRFLRAGAAVGLALAVFFGWEALMTARYGQGMFFGQVEHGLFWVPRGQMVLHLLRLLGATAPALLLLGLAALGATRGILTAGAAVVCGGFLSLLFVPVETLLYPVLGAGLALAVGACASGRLLTAGIAGLSRPARKVDWLLAGWLVVEIGVFFAASPFPAVRRILGLTIVSTVILARALSRQARREALRGVVAVVTALGLLLGGLFWYVDLREAQASPAAVRQALAEIGARSDGSRVWFVGHWGFQHYCEQAGFRPVVPDVSRVRAGDWLLVPDPVDQQRIVLDGDELAAAGRVAVETGPALRTGYGYYGGSSALTHARGPRLTVDLYRARRDFVARSSWTARQLADWAVQAGGRTAAAALPALVRSLASSAADDRMQATRGLAALGRLGAPAVAELGRSLGDAEPAVRYGAARALGAIGDAAARQALEARLDDPDPGVREEVRRALDRLGPG